MRNRVGAIVVKDRALLLVTGFDGTMYWTPGGGKDPGESDEAALRREVREELGAEIASFAPYCAFDAENPITGEAMRCTYYRVELDGDDLVPHDEITGYGWYVRSQLERGEPATFPAFHKQLAPRLLADTII